MTKKRKFSRQLPGFRIDSGTDSAKNGKIDFSFSTDLGQGMNIYQNGNSDFVVNKTSKEVIGSEIKDENTPAKIINAVNGDIHLRAKNGTIILEAANIRLVGVDGVGGEITIQASKIVSIEGATISTQSSGDTTIVSSKTTSIVGAAAADLNAGGNATVTSGTDSDSSSVLGKIMQAITKFKKFLSSICSN